MIIHLAAPVTSTRVPWTWHGASPFKLSSDDLNFAFYRRLKYAVVTRPGWSSEQFAAREPRTPRVLQLFCRTIAACVTGAYL